MEKVFKRQNGESIGFRAASVWIGRCDSMSDVNRIERSFSPIEKKRTSSAKVREAGKARDPERFSASSQVVSRAFFHW